MKIVDDIKTDISDKIRENIHYLERNSKTKGYIMETEK